MTVVFVYLNYYLKIRCTLITDKQSTRVLDEFIMLFGLHRMLKFYQATRRAGGQI